MSQYLNLFVRHKDEFVSIGSYSRSGNMYRIFDGFIRTPYEKIRSLSYNDINAIYNCTAAEIDNLKQAIEKMEYVINLIMASNNSLEDKLDQIASYHEAISDYKSEIEEYNIAKHYINFLQNMMDNVKYGEDNLDPEKFIYIGIECYSPTIEDIMDV